MRQLISVLAAASSLLLPLSVAAAQQGVSEDVVLTIEVEGGTGEAFTLEELRAMPADSFETETIWTSGVQSFTGVPLHELMERLDVDSGVLEAFAINDYAVEIPVSDAVEDGPIIAYERNGELMPVREKGPLWIVYPYDENPDYMNEAIYVRSIWQLDRLVVRP